MKVLLIENDPVSAELLTQSLREAGHDVTASAGGDLSAGLLRSGGWDALVLDLILPGVSGFELLDGGPLPPRVVVTTALDDADLHGLAARHPGVAVLKKPFGTDALLKLLT